MTVSVIDLRTDGRAEPMGTDTRPPRLSWRVVDDEPERRGTSIRSVQVQVARIDLVESGGVEPDFTFWDSGARSDTDGVRLTFDGPELTERTRYLWRVRVETTDGRSSDWSSTTWWETGITTWAGDWIGAPADSPETALTDENSDVIAPAQYLRRAFHIDDVEHVLEARLYVVALGWYQLYVNGVDVTGDALVPRFTSFAHRVEYQAYDVSALLHSGGNVIGLVLSDGRFRGTLSGHHRHAVFGARTAIRAQVEIHLGNGSDLSAVTVGTDTTWTTHAGPILAADPMKGTTVDARLSLAGWDRIVEPTGHWPAAEVVPVDAHRSVVPTTAPPVRGVRSVDPIEIIRVSDTRTVIDFGQNLVGVGDLTLTGRRGETVTITYSEAFDREAGEIDIDYVTDSTPLPTLVQRDSYTYAGSEAERFLAPLTIHGFRYAQIDGPHGDIDSATTSARVIAADLDYSGSFACSHPGLNQLHANVYWSMLGNFTDVPTDCPTRERSGWTADIAVFAPTAVQFADVDRYLSDWLVDLALDQYDDGRPTLVVPDENSERVPKTDREKSIDGASGWGDAAVILPWVLYETYGDADMLERQYESITSWVDYLAETAANNRTWTRSIRGRGGDYESFLLDTGFQFGEWMVPGERPIATIVRNQIIPPAEVATGYFAHSARLAGRIAAVLGRTGDAERFATLSDNATNAWRDAFVDHDGRVDGDEQSSYVRGLEFGLIPPEHVSAAQARLVELVVRNGYRLDTGFLSTARLLDALTESGRIDVAYAVLMQRRDPSWLHQIERGATTVWESWSGVDRRGRPSKSLNHYAFGGVVHWMYDTMVGISSAAPGFTRARVWPRPGGGLSYARAAVPTPFGLLEAGWAFEDAAFVARPDRVHLFTVRLVVPIGLSVELRLPGAAGAELTESGSPVDTADDELRSRVEDSDVVLDVRSGTYEFAYRACDIGVAPVVDLRR